MAERLPLWLKTTFVAGSLLLFAPSSYHLISGNARAVLNSRLASKILEIIDMDGNPDALSVEENVKFYRTIGLNPEEEVPKRGSMTSIDEKQQYLRNVGQFDPRTDTYNFWDGLRL